MPVTKLKRSTSNNNAMLDQNVRSCFKQNPTQLAATSADFSYASDLAQDSYVASTATTNPATANYWNIAAIIACYRFDLFSCAFSAVGEFCAMHKNCIFSASPKPSPSHHLASEYCIPLGCAVVIGSQLGT